jgi:hypothetical protein
MCNSHCPPPSLLKLARPQMFTVDVWFPVAKCIVPDWGDKVDSGIYRVVVPRPARLRRLVGRYDNPMPESTISPHSGTMHLATEVDSLKFDQCSWTWVKRYLYGFTPCENNCLCALESEADWALAMSSGPLWKGGSAVISKYMCSRIA